ncbi:MAG: hypothetical protein ACD_60C00163G0002 [uncultured bacterium]|nr:MAG: hypothetical protein ACD_60C00163G0002 [uncultured bacterium]
MNDLVIEFIFLSTLSFLFGITQKLADGHHEHGLNFFPGAGVVFGALAGGLAFYLIGYSPVLQAAYLGPLLYWFYKQKIDCLPLIVPAIIMLFGVFLSKATFEFPLYGVLYVFLAHVALDYLKHHNPWPSLIPFFKYRLHFHLIMLVYAVAVGSVYGYSTLLFNLLARLWRKEFSTSKWCQIY